MTLYTGNAILIVRDKPDAYQLQRRISHIRARQSMWSPPSLGSGRTFSVTIAMRKYHYPRAFHRLGLVKTVCCSWCVNTLIAAACIPTRPHGKVWERLWSYQRPLSPRR